MQLQDCPPIEYTRRPGQRNIRIRVKNDSIIVSAPWHCSERTMIGFVQEREDWIRKTVAKFQYSNTYQKVLLESKMGHLLLRGEWIPIEIRHQRPGEKKWLLVERSGRIDAYPPDGGQLKSTKTNPIKPSAKNLPTKINTALQQSLFDSTLQADSNSGHSEAVQISHGPHFNPGKTSYHGNLPKIAVVPPNEKRNFLMDVARKELPVKFEEIAAQLPFEWSRLFIRSQKTKWGTCSSKGNISLNWRLIMCPPTILEYLVVHELSHTVHMNHSRKFWDLVANHYPEVDFAHKWLKKEGQICFLI